MDKELQAAIEDVELTQQINDTLDQATEYARKAAQKRIKKQSREIARLRERAELALLTNEKEPYIYAIGKLRAIIDKPVSRDVLETLWTTSREQVEVLVKDGYAKFSK